MAENTFRNSPKEQIESAPKTSFKFPSLKMSFLSDTRVHFLFGTFLLITSFFLLVSFTSYFLTGNADQSIVEVTSELSLLEAANQTENIFGLFGAQIAHFFIYKLFGIASFLFIPIFFLFGRKIVFKSEIPYQNSYLRTLSFAIIWLSVFVGYFLNTFSVKSKFSYFGGSIGYEVSIWLNLLMGWGSIVLIVFLGIVYLVFNFNLIEEKTEEVITETTSEEEEIDEDEEEESDLEEDEEIDEDYEPSFEVHTKEELTVSISEDDTDEFSFSVEKPIVEAKKEFNNLSLEVVDEPIKVEAENLNNTDYASENEGSNHYDPTLDLSHYKFPTLDLLKDYGENKVNVTKEELEENKNKIVATLASYQIDIVEVKATIGPTVTLYRIRPADGVKISKIKNLQDDIAMSLAALGIRIIAPIPGEQYIGIEVPNIKPEMVSMHSVIASDKFQNTKNMDLPIVLGKTISNEVFVTDLAKMPHLLMAGATGQGKSVGLNAILTSLLYKKHPSQLKFVMVDPKKVELSLYSKIEKHFLASIPDSDEPIITDTKKVVNTLNSLCIEMDNRYDLLKEAGCRNLKEYNQKFVERRLNPQNGHRFMPYIVLVIDELADLMMTAGKEVETPIARLAQLARAIGIHLIVATQRPSVNVITGIIKANFPARLSFKVTSKVDSRTILDTGGADQLIGKGDMLLSNGSDIIRIQCAFVDTPECDNICDFIQAQQGYGSSYELPEFVGEEGGGNSDVDLSDRDQFFDEAARLIVQNQQGSTSLIQRKMKLGYNRAGRIMDQLEAAGVVGQSQGSKARDVLIPDEYSLEQLLSSLNSKDY